MTKQFISIVEISPLHDILNEIKSIFSFKIHNFINTKDFLTKITSTNSEISNSIIVSKKNNHELLSSEKIDTNCLILVDDRPIKINQLLDKINIFLIKQKYNFQSQLIIKNYMLNLNSRTISTSKENLKLTEREIDVILFLMEKVLPQSVNSLQNEVWKYANTLETHTVETHIYRLRKKMKDKFNDNNFIVSSKEGYKI
tara:strand:- start:73 stop:669 length:597 start_codon:yes stop_codon:yes gene_type:complete